MLFHNSERGVGGRGWDIGTGHNDGQLTSYILLSENFLGGVYPFRSVPFIRVVSELSC